MAKEVTNELMYKVLIKIQDDVAHIKKRVDEHDLKIGTLAEGMISMRKDMHEMRDEMNGMRTDLRMVALAVDQHTIRLDHIDARLGLHDA